MLGTKNDEGEIIVLSHFQNRLCNSSYNYIPSEYKLDEESAKKSEKAKRLAKKQKKLGVKSRGYNFEPTYVKDEKIEKDNIKKTELFINNSLKTYYEVDKDKINEIFSKLKSKEELKDIHILSNEKIFILDQPEGFINNNMISNFSEINNDKSTKPKIKIYENHFFKLLNEIELENDLVKKWKIFGIGFKMVSNKE